MNKNYIKTKYQHQYSVLNHLNMVSDDFTEIYAEVDLWTQKIYISCKHEVLFSTEVSQHDLLNLDKAVINCLHQAEEKADFFFNRKETLQIFVHCQMHRDYTPGGFVKK